MTDETAVRKAFANQVEYCRANDAPITGRIVEAIISVLTQETRFGALVLGWAGNPLADALSLRCAGGFHALHLSGTEPELAALYEGNADALVNAETLIGNAIVEHEDALLPWLDGPPQTNEAGRSSNYVAALLWLVSRGLPSNIEMLEIGSSAGLNLMLDRYHYDLAGVEVGPKDSPISFKPEWRGPPPPQAEFDFVSTRGCDIAPVNLADPAQALRLNAYIWPEHHVRFGRMAAGIEMVKQHAPDLVQGDADEWIDTALTNPQAEGTARVLMHSIVWQYLGPERQARITALIEAAGAKATPERPLAWIALEANRNNFRHELVVRQWPGDGQPVMLGTSHAHGAWIEWTGA